ncbi:hypothetical protein HGA64_03965 [Candidatus Falkowbacteria bacterium]|nr:hypothetical protein [Candidatus Falkowbacteria bacterium]
MCLYIATNPKLKEKIVSGAYDKAATEVSLAEMINDYIRQYFWVKTDFCDSGIITAETLLQDSAKELASNSDIAGEINRIDDSLAKIKEEQKKIMGSLTLSKEDEADIFFSRKTALWIDRRKLGMMKQVYYLIAFVKDVAKIYGLPYREAAFYSVDEMIGLLQGNGAKDNGLSKEGGFVVYETGKKHRIFYGSDGWKFLELAKRVEGGSELKGMIASKGDGSVVEGVVRIVANPQSDKFAEGDILVTSMTRIEFVPLMRKARAIITNEGGIACHAAIVSRELGIPCIIGTKVATETLKSGDRVRLDMRTGIVSPL